MVDFHCEIFRTKRFLKCSLQTFRSNFFINVLDIFQRFHRSRVCSTGTRKDIVGSVNINPICFYVCKMSH